MTDNAAKECGDTVTLNVGGDDVVAKCTRPAGHPIKGLNERLTLSTCELHEGGGWSWDNRCAWKKGEEP